MNQVSELVAKIEERLVDGDQNLLNGQGDSSVFDDVDWDNPSNRPNFFEFAITYNPKNNTFGYYDADDFNKCDYGYWNINNAVYGIIECVTKINESTYENKRTIVRGAIDYTFRDDDIMTQLKQANFVVVGYIDVGIV